jgi:hypothetical protein
LLRPCFSTAPNASHTRTLKLAQAETGQHRRQRHIIEPEIQTLAKAAFFFA